MLLTHDPDSPAGKLAAQRRLQWAEDQPASDVSSGQEEAAAHLTGLDPVETNQHAHARLCAEYPEPASESDVGFRHSGWLPQRARTYAALAEIADSPRRLNRFARCGADAWVMRAKDDVDRLSIRADLCHDRFCQPCMTARGHIVAANLRARIGRHPHRLITLTVRGHGQPLSDILNHLYKSFIRLRRSRVWKEHVQGGVVVCEITWSANSQSWHPHLHIIAAGTYMQKQLLSDAWLLATGDSYIVDLRLIRGVETCVRYVTKYVSKPLSPTYAREPDLLREAMRALAGRRLCTTIGTWRGVPLYAVTSDTEWEPLGRLSEIRAKALAGDQAATAIMASLGRFPEDQCVAPVDPSLWDT